MTHKAIRISLGARPLLALLALGLLLIVLSSGWQLRQTTLQRAAETGAELSAIPLMYAGPLAYSLQQRPQKPEAVHGLLHHILTRHKLRHVELRTPDGEQFVTGITVGRLLDHYYVERADVLKLTVDRDLEDEIFQDGANWQHRVEALVLGARDEEQVLQSATAQFPVRRQRGSTRLYAR